MTAPEFDVAAAHRHFASHCFNASWKVILQPDRTPEEDDTLVALGNASLWHWTNRADCTDKNLSIAHWLLARIHCVVGRPVEAARHATRSLSLAERPGVAAYFRGAAHEACARAASLQGDRVTEEQHRDSAIQIAATLDDKEQKMLLDDLATIRP